MRLDPNPSIPWPEGRLYHSSVTITSVSSTGERKHYLVVLGGWNGSTVNNTWILDIERKEWKQVHTIIINPTPIIYDYCVCLCR